MTEDKLTLFERASKMADNSNENFNLQDFASRRSLIICEDEIIGSNKENAKLVRELVSFDKMSIYSNS
jgi:hypothetical protein